MSTFIQHAPNGMHTLHLLVEGIHCPSCIAVIEGGLKKYPDVQEARLNLSTRRLKLQWHGDAQKADAWIEAVNQMGYHAVPFDPETRETGEQKAQQFLLRCLAVAGFASGNLMLFSVPIWSSDAVSMGEATRSMFHWIQAGIAIPAIAYAGRPFFLSAWKALKEWHTNMDVPISVAIILATLMSLFETFIGGKYAYFDSAVMLLFFLLIGRYLEARARGRARSAASDLLQMMEGTATYITESGQFATIPFSQLTEGMTLLVAAGERFGADGEITEGTCDVDASMITGETLPQTAQQGSKVFAGMVNLSGAVRVRVLKPGEHSLIAEIVRLMETAEQGQARYVTLADRISRWYTPTVHALAAMTFISWLVLGDAPWQQALLYAATVLIITCPCALGLAVPVVQVVASGKLMRAGILLKSGSALERLATIEHAIFDKTGTLTLGQPVLLGADRYEPEFLQLAASLACYSKHPLSRAVVAAYKGELVPLDVKEIPGCGLEAILQGKTVRLGKAEWCYPHGVNGEQGLELWLVDTDGIATCFSFADALRDDAARVIAELKAAAIDVSLYSGDREVTARHVGAQLGIDDVRAALLPEQKVAALTALKMLGKKVLMVGDGLNDAPSLAAADVSMSPANAMDISQNAADIVFQGKGLSAVTVAWKTARFAQQLVQQNFALALLYNVIAIPLAVAGYVTPLIAAIAMSSSSLIVIANALRLYRR